MVIRKKLRDEWSIRTKQDIQRNKINDRGLYIIENVMESKRT